MRQKRRPRQVRVVAKVPSTLTQNPSLTVELTEESLSQPPTEAMLQFIGKRLIKNDTPEDIAKALGMSEYEWAMRCARHPQIEKVIRTIRKYRSDSYHEKFNKDDLVPALATPATAANKDYWTSLEKKQKIFSKQKQEDAPDSFQDNSFQQNISISSNINEDKMMQLLKKCTPDPLTLSVDSHITNEQDQPMEEPKNAPQA